VNLEGSQKTKFPNIDIICAASISQALKKGWIALKSREISCPSLISLFVMLRLLYWFWFVAVPRGQKPAKLGILLPFSKA
jgi:hypothetical protein